MFDFNSDFENHDNIFDDLYKDHGGNSELESCSFLTKEEMKIYSKKSKPFHHLARAEKEDCYEANTIVYIQVIYIFAVIVWFIIIWYLGLYTHDAVVWFLLFVPLIIFGINYVCLESSTTDVEDEMFTGNFIYFVFIAAAIVISWSKVATGSSFFRIVLVALVLIMFSLIDLWLPKEKLVITKHARTIFQTTALTLITVALYSYYVEVILNVPEVFGDVRLEQTQFQ